MLISAGIQIHKYAVRALNKARTIIDEAKKRHEEELRLEKLEEERLKELGQKPPKKPKKPKKSKGDELYLRMPYDLYPQYFRLQMLEFKYCQINEDCADALTVFIQKVSQHISQLSLEGNDIGSRGLEGISIGFEEAFKEVQWREKRQANKKAHQKNGTCDRSAKPVKENEAQSEDSDFDNAPLDSEKQAILRLCSRGSSHLSLQTLNL